MYVFCTKLFRCSCTCDSSTPLQLPTKCSLFSLLANSWFTNKSRCMSQTCLGDLYRICCSWGPEPVALHDPWKHGNVSDLVQGSLLCSLLCRDVKISLWHWIGGCYIVSAPSRSVNLLSVSVCLQRESVLVPACWCALGGHWNKGLFHMCSTKEVSFPCVNDFLVNTSKFCSYFVSICSVYLSYAV